MGEASVGRAVLEFDDLEVRYGDVRALRGVSLRVMPGECVGVVGESGSGKSTLAKAAMGLLDAPGRACAGRVLFEGRDIAEMSGEELRRLRGPGMGLVPQDAIGSFTPVRTFGAQAFEAARAHGRPSRRSVREELCEILGRLDVDDPERVLKSHPFELSGGLGQRAAMALAMYFRPKVLFADEPTSALDAIARKQTVEALGRLKEETGTALVVITHDIGVARRLADRIVVMEGGLVVEEGPVEEVFSRPRHRSTKELVEAVASLEARFAPGGVCDGGRACACGGEEGGCL